MKFLDALRFFILLFVIAGCSDIIKKSGSTKINSRTILLQLQNDSLIIRDISNNKLVVQVQNIEFKDTQIYNLNYKIFSNDIDRNGTLDLILEVYSNYNTSKVIYLNQIDSISKIELSPLYSEIYLFKGDLFYTVFHYPNGDLETNLLKFKFSSYSKFDSLFIVNNKIEDFINNNGIKFGIDDTLDDSSYYLKFWKSKYK